MGVWIEIYYPEKGGPRSRESHPLWVCGLKFPAVPAGTLQRRHTLYGCVD